MVESYPTQYWVVTVYDDITVMINTLLLVFVSAISLDIMGLIMLLHDILKILLALLVSQYQRW